ncbi:hypothetical protein RHGRI_009879 [Rhododendron griersonianum]|uniref:Uncharacterized protein n=1 Tax=Rhododendron griersonianum TaxID=479676 RepID=A0AAV6KGI0_9ERIC|nr:hypothetical protein RHGRI_009879 [Rhododendron griersonianum]
MPLRKATRGKKRQSPKQKNIAKKRQRLTQESEPEPDSPTQTQKQCTFRSNVIGTLGLLSKLNLNNTHLELLKQTPFWMLIDAIKKGKLAEKACMKHDKPILSIIENYDTNDSKFLIGGKMVAITRNDIKLTFGIACGIKPIGDLNKKKSDVAFATRRGIQEARIGVTIAWTYVHCMEKIEEIKDYDWAQSIAETLNTSMHKFHDKPRDATGCVVALMMMQHTQSPQSPVVQRLDEIHLTEKQQTSPLVSTSSPQQQQPVFSQSQSGETMVSSTYQPLDSINFSQGVIKEHSQMGKFCDSLLEDNDQVIIKDLQQQVKYLQNQKQILEQRNHGLQKDKDAIKNQLEEMEKERDALKEKLQKMVTMSNTMLQTQEQHKVLIEKTADLEKDSNAMKNQLLEMEKERDSLEEKLQKMDTLSNVLKKDRDEMENQLLEMGKEKDSLKETLQNMDAMSDNNKKALTMQIESLTTEKGQLQKYLNTTEQRQKAIIVQKDAEIRSLINKLSLTSKLSIQPRHTKEPQKHLPAVETDSSLLTQRSEEAIHNITQTYTDQKIEQVTFLGGDQNSANRALDAVSSKILKTRTILIPIYGSNHYTLLELDTIDQEWRFYNSIRRQGRRDKYCEATATLRNNVTNYINQHSNKKIKTSAKLLKNTPQQEPGSVDCADVVAYIIRQKLMKQPIQSNNAFK